MKQTQENVEVTRFVRVKKIDEEKRVVYGEVYAPDILDTYGDFMSDDDVQLMAHRFMQLTNLAKTIDTNHNEKPNGSFPIESFVARDGDPDYTPGAWVLGVKVTDDEVWKQIKKGELNGYSFQALVRRKAVVVDVEASPDSVGITGKAEGHDHLYFAYMDEDGKVTKGITDTVDGHSHTISMGTATDEAKGHAHRIELG